MMLLHTQKNPLSQNNFAMWGRTPEMEGDLENMSDKDSGASAWEHRQAHEKVRKAWCAVRWESGPRFISPILAQSKMVVSLLLLFQGHKKRGRGRFCNSKNVFLTLHTDFECDLDIWLHRNSQKWEFREVTGYCQPVKNNIERLFYLLISFCKKKVILGRKTKFNKKLKFYLLCCIPLTK